MTEKLWRVIVPSKLKMPSYIDQKTVCNTEYKDLCLYFYSLSPDQSINRILTKRLFGESFCVYIRPKTFIIKSRIVMCTKKDILESLAIYQAEKKLSPGSIVFQYNREIEKYVL